MSMFSNIAAKFALPFVAFGLFLLALWKAYSSGKSVATETETLKAVKLELKEKTKREIERNAGIKIMSDNSLLERDELIASLRVKPDQGGT